MNREIKFRAKIQGEENFTYSNGFLKHPADGIIVIISKIHDEHFETSPIEEGTLCQFIGLKDKNGVEIYEGDILKTRDSEKFDGETTLSDLLIVEEYNKFIYTVMYSEDNSGLNGYTQEDIEIIGNIHQNAELLNKQ